MNDLLLNLRMDYFGLLIVLDTPEDVYEGLPGKLFVYGASSLRLGPSRSDFSVSWYFNGVRIANT